MIGQGPRPVETQAAVAAVSAVAPALRAPEPLNVKHDVSRFSNGVHPSLDEWLRERAHRIEGLSARTYVVCAAAEPDRVVGYFSISAAVEQRNALPSAKIRRGMPEQVPLLLIGRLTVDAQWQRRGLGSALLADALRDAWRHPKSRGYAESPLTRSTRRRSPSTRVTVLRVHRSASASC